MRNITCRDDDDDADDNDDDDDVIGTYTCASVACILVWYEDDGVELYSIPHGNHDLLALVRRFPLLFQPSDG